METKPEIKVLIMCGGKGTRMWPISNMDHPKQFEGLLGKRSIFAEFVARVLKRFKPEDVYIATSEKFKDQLKKQAPQIPDKNLVLEPAMRDNLGAVGLATSVIAKRHPKAVMIMLWGADHVIQNDEVFLDAICEAASLAATHDRIVHVDCFPTYPSVHNGWIKIGQKVKTEAKHDVYEFLQQVEKPDLETAQKLFRSHEYLIHVGYMATKPSLLLSYYQKYAPQVYVRLEKISKVIDTPQYQSVLEEEYPQMEKIAIDYGIFEKLPAKSQWDLPVDMGWIDVGTWELLYHGLDKDNNGNVIIGKVNLLDVTDSLIINHQEKTVGLIGLSNMIVVNSDAGLLVCPMAQAPKVKELYNSLYQN